MDKKTITQIATAALITTAGISVTNNLKPLNITGSGGEVKAATTQSAQEFIDKAATAATNASSKYGTYTSVMIAQAAVESGYGNSTLSQEPNNNLFGVKGDYNGQSVTMTTGEYGSNGYYTTDASFRKYPSYEESFNDNGALLRSQMGDYYSGTWVENSSSGKEATENGLQGKYATAPNYSQTLNDVIDTYNLEQYDPQTTEVNETKTVTNTTPITDAPVDSDVGTKVGTAREGQEVNVTKYITYNNGVSHAYIGSGWVNSSAFATDQTNTTQSTSNQVDAQVDATATSQASSTTKQAVTTQTTATKSTSEQVKTAQNNQANSTDKQTEESTTKHNVTPQLSSSTKTTQTSQPQSSSKQTVQSTTKQTATTQTTSTKSTTDEVSNTQLSQPEKTQVKATSKTVVKQQVKEVPATPTSKDTAVTDQTITQKNAETTKVEVSAKTNTTIPTTSSKATSAVQSTTAKATSQDKTLKAVPEVTPAKTDDSKVVKNIITSKKIETSAPKAVVTTPDADKKSESTEKKDISQDNTHTSTEGSVVVDKKVDVDTPIKTAQKAQKSTEPVQVVTTTSKSTPATTPKLNDIAVKKEDKGSKVETDNNSKPASKSLSASTQKITSKKSTVVSSVKVDSSLGKLTTKPISETTTSKKVAAEASQVGNDYVIKSTGVVTINARPDYGVAIWTVPGKTRTSRYLKNGTSWKFFKVAMINGEKWYNLGGNQWVPAKAVMVR